MFPDLHVQPPLPGAPARSSLPSAGVVARARAGDEDACAEVERAARMLETHFVTWMLREMRNTVPEGGLLPSGPAQDIYEQMLDDALAQSVASGRGLGLAQAIEAQLLSRSPEPPPQQPRGE